MRRPEDLLSRLAHCFSLDVSACCSGYCGAAHHAELSLPMASTGDLFIDARCKASVATSSDQGIHREAVQDGCPQVPAAQLRASAPGPPEPMAALFQDLTQQPRIQELKAMMREFAREVVGPGIGIEVLYQQLPTADRCPAILRMDTRLTCLELALSHPEVPSGSEMASLVFHLRDIARFEALAVRDDSRTGAGGSYTADAKTKACYAHPAGQVRQAVTISMRADAPTLIMFFATETIRDQAWRSLRIIHRSVTQADEVRDVTHAVQPLTDAC